MRQPNIVQIVVDDLGFGDLGRFNGGVSQTPVIDGLLGDGVCLTQLYSASPVCAPARAGLLTGRYPQRGGVVDTLEGRGADRLSLRERTMADVLSQQGYATGLVGKWHNGALDERYHPNRRGFSEFCGFRGGWMDFWDWRLERNGSAWRSDGRYLTDVLTDEAVSFVRRHRDDPFYLHLAYNAPHFPIQAPEAVVARYAERGAFTAAVATLYAMVEVLDSGIGRVLDELATLGLDAGTIVMFTSDNGPDFGGGGEQALARFNCGFNGAKTLVYEGGVRVPGAVRWPDGLAGGRTVHDMVHFVDCFPTLLAMVDATTTPSPLELDGVDVLPLLRGEPGHAETTRFWQWSRYEPVRQCNAAMRDGDWKLLYPAIDGCFAIAPDDERIDHELVYHPDLHTDIRRDPPPERSLAAPGRPELYNLAADPLESHNRAQQQPERTARMAADLETWFDQVEHDRRQAADPSPAGPR